MDRTELYAYVKAKLALMDGNKEDAIHWLQVAEASLLHITLFCINKFWKRFHNLVHSRLKVNRR